jgi:hypothetical protein
LKINSSGNGIYWGTDNNTTYDTSDFAAADHSHSYATRYNASNTDCAGRTYVKAGGHKSWVLTCGAGEGASNIFGATASSLVTASSSSSRRFKHNI